VTGHFVNSSCFVISRSGELCVDERPAVRKSSGQTLFSTISAHSNILNKYSWDSVMWQVTIHSLSQLFSVGIISLCIIVNINRCSFHCWKQLKNLGKMLDVKKWMDKIPF